MSKVKYLVCALLLASAVGAGAQVVRTSQTVPWWYYNGHNIDGTLVTNDCGIIATTGTFTNLTVSGTLTVGGVVTNSSSVSASNLTVTGTTTLGLLTNTTAVITTGTVTSATITKESVTSSTITLLTNTTAVITTLNTAALSLKTNLVLQPIGSPTNTIYITNGIIVGLSSP